MAFSHWIRDLSAPKLILMCYKKPMQIRWSICAISTTTPNKPLSSLNWPNLRQIVGMCQERDPHCRRVSKILPKKTIQTFKFVHDLWLELFQEITRGKMGLNCNRLRLRTWIRKCSSWEHSLPTRNRTVSLICQNSEIVLKSLQTPIETFRVR